MMLEDFLLATFTSATTSVVSTSVVIAASTDSVVTTATTKDDQDKYNPKTSVTTKSAVIHLSITS